MEFPVIAHDRTDHAALARRMVVRERCRAAARRTIRSGNVLSGGATLGEDGHMVGSTAVLSFPGRIAFHKLAGKRFPTTVPGTGSRARSIFVRLPL